MEITITSIITITLFLEAVIQAAKPIWNSEAKKLSLPESLSMAIGILVAVLGKINLLEGLITVGAPALLYVLYVLSGIALGRGPSFIHDLWQKIRTFDMGAATEAAKGVDSEAVTDNQPEVPPIRNDLDEDSK